MTKRKMVIWQWKGSPGEFIPGVPARDMTDDEVERRGIKDLVEGSAKFEKTRVQQDDKNEEE